MSTLLNKALLVLLCSVSIASADVFDFLKSKKNSDGSAAGVPGLSEEQVAQGLKEALANGVKHSITNLGHDGGFLTNVNVRIPIPDSLKYAEKAARSLKQDQLADEFVATMNHAAEMAVPETANILADALKGMTVDDAKAIIKGPDDAATKFFQRTSGAGLVERMLPIVKQTTAKAEVTRSYEKLVGVAGTATRFFKLKSGPVDLDSYVTQKAADGLFKTIAEEEKRIRQNPAARTTELLQKIFSK